MNLKDAYRYQNYLSELYSEAVRHLSDSKFVTKTVKIHHRTKVDKDAIDEAIEEKSDLSFSPNDIINITMDILKEKEKLTFAIHNTKKSTMLNIDGMASINKDKQRYIEYLKTLVDRKSFEREETGTGYKFDVNNEQKSYRYPITSVTTIDFDRNAVKKLIKKLSVESDNYSTEIEKCLLLEDVNYTPKWDLSDTLEDIIQTAFV